MTSIPLICLWIYFPIRNRQFYLSKALITIFKTTITLSISFTSDLTVCGHLISPWKTSISFKTLSNHGLNSVTEFDATFGKMTSYKPVSSGNKNFFRQYEIFLFRNIYRINGAQAPPFWITNSRPA